MNMKTEVSEQTAALGHIRVLDLSRILAGPWAAQILGDLGADVIKVENPRGGDDTRQWGPPFCAGIDGAEGDAAYFTACNRNKRSVGVDFSTPKGAEIIRELARHCDVVIENYKVGGLAKYGIDYDALRKVKPDIIYCSVTGFGQTGPYAHRGGYDFLIQGMAGLMSVTGAPDGQPGGGPMKVGVAVSDLFTGMYAAVSILAALAHRAETGEGQYIDCALFDSQVAMLANQAANWMVGEVKPERLGNNHPNVVPYRTYPVSDGHVIVAVGNDGQFRRMCRVLGADDLANDPQYLNCADRVRNRHALDAALCWIFSRYARHEIIKLLEEENVPCGPINDIPDVFADPNTKARELVVSMIRDDGAEIRTVAFPAKLSKTPASYRLAPPSHGGDTDSVLAQLIGYKVERIARLKETGIIG